MLLRPRLAVPALLVAALVVAVVLVVGSSDASHARMRPVISRPSSAPLVRPTIPMREWRYRQDALCRTLSTTVARARAQRLAAARVHDDVAVQQGGASVGFALRQLDQRIAAVPAPAGTITGAHAYLDGAHLEIAQLVRTFAVNSDARPAAAALARTTAAGLDPFARRRHMPSCLSTA